MADRPVITRMSDRRLTLCWKPSVSIAPRIPVTYQVEMLELPEGDWITVRTGVRSCTCEVRNLVPFKDYRFRIRVENQYGVSDPSPYVQTYRHKLEPPAPHVYTYLDSNTDFRPDQSPYFPKDFDIERPPHDGYAQAPMYVLICCVFFSSFWCNSNSYLFSLLIVDFCVVNMISPMAQRIIMWI